VNTAMSLWVPQKEKHFLFNWVTISFSRILLHRANWKPSMSLSVMLWKAWSSKYSYSRHETKVSITPRPLITTGEEAACSLESMQTWRRRESPPLWQSGKFKNNVKEETDNCGFRCDFTVKIDSDSFGIITRSGKVWLPLLYDSNFG
jgi:hypothetical protein